MTRASAVAAIRWCARRFAPKARVAQRNGLQDMTQQSTQAFLSLKFSGLVQDVSQEMTLLQATLGTIDVGMEKVEELYPQESEDHLVHASYL